MTLFEKAVFDAKNGDVTTPIVSQGDRNIDFFGYQLAVCKGQLQLMSIGMKFRNVKLKNIKAYYGLKGKTAKDCLPELEVIAYNYLTNLRKERESTIADH